MREEFPCHDAITWYRSIYRSFVTRLQRVSDVTLGRDIRRRMVQFFFSFPNRISWMTWHRVNSTSLITIYTCSHLPESKDPMFLPRRAQTPNLFRNVFGLSYQRVWLIRNRYNLSDYSITWRKTNEFEIIQGSACMIYMDWKQNWCPRTTGPLRRRPGSHTHHGERTEGLLLTGIYAYG